MTKEAHWTDRYKSNRSVANFYRQLQRGSEVMYADIADPGPGGGEDVREVYRRAMHLFKMGRYKDALPLLAYLSVRTPQLSACHYNIGTCFHRLGDHKAAVQSYITAFALDHADLHSLFHAADCLLKAGARPEAEQALRLFLEEAVDERYATYRARAQAILETLDAKARDERLSLENT
ncbi:tetratricopeptide repeat protein [Variovorax saccharolyticus]|uniref:tetratricopeptide repeat protein n=1 Tax=Variovorax saccharolyticus TaxID=3053516 RepID=UPI0025790A7F|nr:tetratricopeptide repeat protein [Variovorax sp. J31P216]MDM0030182.1 tetratricopeptide repeat protein [Variovorax sp. J31P216]